MCIYSLKSQKYLVRGPSMRLYYFQWNLEEALCGIRAVVAGNHHTFVWLCKIDIFCLVMFDSAFIILEWYFTSGHSAYTPCRVIWCFWWLHDISQIRTLGQNWKVMEKASLGGFMATFPRSCILWMPYCQGELWACDCTKNDKGPVITDCLQLLLPN